MTDLELLNRILVQFKIRAGSPRDAKGRVVSIGGGTLGTKAAAGSGSAATGVRGSGGLAGRLNFVKPPGSGLTTVHVSVAKLEASLAQTPGFHVGAGGTGAAIAGRYPQAQRFLADAANSGIPVHMTRIYVDREGRASIGDGRHRFAVLRDSGATTVPVAVPRGNAARAQRLFGAEAVSVGGGALGGARPPATATKPVAATAKPAAKEAIKPAPTKSAPTKPAPTKPAPTSPAAPAKGPLTRIREGTPEQRAALAANVRQMRAVAATPELHTEMAQRLRSMRASRRGQEPPVQRPRGAGRPGGPAAARPAAPAAAPARAGAIPHVDPKLKPRVAHAAFIQGEHAAAADRLAAAAGMTPARYREAVGGKLADAVGHGDLYIRADSANLRSILEEGRFKTQFETGTSRGSLDALGRTKAEAELFGTVPGVAPSARPVYGYVSRPGFASVGKPAESALETYGDAAIRLKPEVRARATVTVGDSLSKHDMLQGVPATRPTADALPMPGPSFARVSPQVLASRSPGETLDHLQRSYGYVEAQYHGGLKAHDIAEVALTGPPAPALRGLLEKQGIPWRVIRNRE